MITSGEIRAARAYMGWTRQQLADRAKVALNSVTRMEMEQVDPRLDTLMAVRRTFEKHGIEFLSVVESREGIRIRQKSDRATKR
ncbi:helix-turn-helix domain-containing protein [Dongia rigui]|uniref:Helix-turn-helix domain-containing protein n=1 Tax=Dongia rigui TaxID=940149 RepID=A0ABU5DZC1_9PROT|nr:helix-turn-helix domain-containing protein [Dongia rigui]MDY0872651.1 helix-turn-helix domain-containing protein [Dongia rigui]